MLIYIPWKKWGGRFISICWKPPWPSGGLGSRCHRILWTNGPAMWHTGAPPCHTMGPKDDTEMVTKNVVGSAPCQQRTKMLVSSRMHGFSLGKITFFGHVGNSAQIDAFWPNAHFLIITSPRQGWCTYAPRGGYQWAPNMTHKRPQNTWPRVHDAPHHQPITAGHGTKRTQKEKNERRKFAKSIMCFSAGVPFWFYFDSGYEVREYDVGVYFHGVLQIDVKFRSVCPSYILTDHNNPKNLELRSRTSLRKKRFFCPEGKNPRASRFGEPRPPAPHTVFGAQILKKMDFEV